MNIADFLKARLDEDERDAIAARDSKIGSPFAAVGDAEWRSDGEHVYGRPNGVVIVADPYGYLGDELGAHIARWDPKRVLAEVAGKRAILGLHEYELDVEYDQDDIGVDVERCSSCREPWPCPTLRILAALYAEHPAYRREWTP